MRFLVVSLLAVFILAPSRPAAQRAAPADTRNASAAEAARYVGLRYRGDSMPAGLKWVGGALVSDPYKDAKDYKLTEVHRGRVRMLLFDSLTHRDAAGMPHWEVKDVLVLPRVPRNQLITYSLCWLGGRLDREIAAVVEYTDTEYFTRVRRAWRANRATEKFEAIPTKGIKCENEGYGV